MSRLFETPSEKPSESLITRVPAQPSHEFSSDQRQTLLRIAHHAIISALERPDPYHRGHGGTQEPFPETPASAALAEPRGVFTTLYLNGALHRELRGCVGFAVPVAPLYRAVIETARAAAFEDSRFLPVTREEARVLEVSLSVLSRLAPIAPEAVEVGRHGLVISRGAHRGLLLPQVPIEHGWDRETFLEQASRKAGLPLNAWREDASIEAFTAEVFSDTDTDVESPR
jgi:AmmeMemoRadiSam system protein A